MTLLTMASYEWFEEWEGTRLGKRGQDYLDLKNGMAQELLEWALTIFPQLRDKVLSQCLFVDVFALTFAFTVSYYFKTLKEKCKSHVIHRINKQATIRSGSKHWREGLNGYLARFSNSAKLLLQNVKLMKAHGISSSPDDVTISEVWKIKLK